jgi:hypothetical protein
MPTIKIKQRNGDENVGINVQEICSPVDSGTDAMLPLGSKYR